MKHFNSAALGRLFSALILASVMFVFTEKAHCVSLDVFYVTVQSSYRTELDPQAENISEVLFKGSGIVFKVSGSEQIYVLAPSHLASGINLDIRISELDQKLSVQSINCQARFDLCLIKVTATENHNYAIFDSQAERFKMKNIFSKIGPQEFWQIPNLGGRYYAIELIPNTNHFSKISDRTQFLVVPKNFNQIVKDFPGFQTGFFNDHLVHSHSISNSFGYGPGWSGAVVLSASLNSEFGFIEFDIEQLLTSFDLSTRNSLGPKKNKITEFIKQHKNVTDSFSDIRWSVEDGRLVAQRIIHVNGQVYLQEFRSRFEIPIGNGIIADGKKITEQNQDDSTFLHHQLTQRSK